MSACLGRVMLLHGVGRSARSMRRMAAALEAARFETLNLTYPSRAKPLQALVEDVHAAAGDFWEMGEGRAHIVCHSMGGLVARAYIHRYRPKTLGRVVMLGTPNQGSQLADWLDWNPAYHFLFGPAGAQLGTRAVARLQDTLGGIDFPLGVIAGARANRPLAWLLLPKPNDGRVTVAATRVAGMADHVTAPATHDGLMLNCRAQSQVVAFLRQGQFIREPNDATRHGALNGQRGQGR
jgi:pimeloyl-ACP methyl ester carboxylesterase